MCRSSKASSLVLDGNFGVTVGQPPNGNRDKQKNVESGMKNGIGDMGRVASIEKDPRSLVLLLTHGPTRKLASKQTKSTASSFSSSPPSLSPQRHTETTILRNNNNNNNNDDNEPSDSSNGMHPHSNQGGHAECRWQQQLLQSQPVLVVGRCHLYHFDHYGRCRPGPVRCFRESSIH